MYIASGVVLRDLHPTIVLAALIVERIYAEAGQLCVITSAADSIHQTDSLHYKGRALDFRTRNTPGAVRQRIYEECKTRLGADYDVVLGPDHLHVEYDPKERPGTYARADH